MTDLFKFQQDTYDSCQRLLEHSGLSRVEFSDLLKESYEYTPDLKEFLEQFDPFSWYSKLFSFKTEKDILVWFKGCGGVITSMKKYNDDRKFRKKEEKQDEEIEQLKNKNEQDWKNLREESKRNSQDLKDIGDKIKRQKEEEKKVIDEITRNKNNPDTPREESFDEQCKREYTEKTERKLREKNISDAQLSQKLGVSDWKVEMNKSSGWRTAQTFSFSIKEAIDKMENEVVCDYCKETKSLILGKDAYAIPSKKKKFCSYDCKSAWEKENKKKDDDKKDNPSNRNGKFQNFDVNEFFAWMKKMGVAELNFDFDNNQVVIKLKNGKNLDIKKSGLSAKQQEDLTTQLKSTSEPITFSEVESKFNKKGNNDGKNGNAGIIAAVIVVGLILAVIIGVVISKNRKKEGY